MTMLDDTDSDSASDAATALDEMTINDEAEYVSLPPPGSFSPPSQAAYSPQLTPTGPPSTPYLPYADNADYGYYTPQMPMSALGPHFSPLSQSSHTQEYGYDMQPQPAGMVPGPMLSHTFPPLPDGYTPHTPMSQPRMRDDRGRDMGGNRVYRPPHIIALEQQQQQYSHVQAAAVAMQHMQGYGAPLGYAEQRGVWYSPPPPPPSHPLGGRMLNTGSQGIMNSRINDTRAPPRHRMERGRENFGSRHNCSQDIPYTPRSNYSRRDDQPQMAHASYVMTTPIAMRRGLQGGREAGAAGLSQLRRAVASSRQGNVIRFANTPHTPVSLSKGQPGQYSQQQHQQMPIYRSPVLEDFRINKSGRKWDLSDIRGHIVEFSGDQFGSRFIQQKLESSSAEDRQRIFDEIMLSAYMLMSDVFGNYVIQKMLELGDAKQKALLATAMEGNVVHLSMHMYGCRVIQKALDHLSSDLRGMIIKELEPSFVQCVVSPNANHVIQRLVVNGPPDTLPTAFLGSLEVLATNPYGCRVVQKMFELMPDEAKRELLDEMHPISMVLMQDQFGNYVVQSVITVGSEDDRSKVVNRLKGQMFPMSRHKFASNVCEKALVHCQPQDRRDLVNELIGTKSDGTTNIPTLLRDAFGNFPLQTALMCTEDDQRVKLLDLIIPVIPQIANTPVGKRLQARFAAWEAEGLITSATEAGANTRAYEEAQTVEPDDTPSSPEEAHLRELSQASSVETTEPSYTPESPPTCSSSDTDTEATTTPVLPRSQLKQGSSTAPSRPKSRDSQKKVASLQSSRQNSLADTSSNWRRTTSANATPALEKADSAGTIVASVASIASASNHGDQAAEDERTLERLLK